MKKFKWIIYVLLVSLPLIIGYGFNILAAFAYQTNSIKLFNIYDSMYLLWKYVGLIYWLIVGRIFANIVSEKRWLGIIYGNILWAILLFIYIWQFHLVSVESMIQPLASISQFYILGFVPFAGKALSFFFNTINSSVAVILSYLLMFGVFLIGYISKKYKK